MKTLKDLRAEIDALDVQLLNLLNKRAGLARMVGASKGAEIKFSPARESLVLRRLIKDNKGPMPDRAVRAVFREIIGGCLSLQQVLKVSYLGPRGTYSEEAARARFGQAASLEPCDSLDEALGLAEKGSVHAAILPIENSAEGTVARTLDMLLKTQLVICDEVLLPVQHKLLSPDESAGTVHEVLAHPQALAQCRQWLALHLPHAKQTPASSNGEAAQLASGRKGAAAIAGKSAAGLYKLNILAENIHDDPGNATRFIVLGKTPAARTGNDKTSLVCAAPNAPGALLKLLEVFAMHNVNMVKLESRPAASIAWEYVFYIDVDGHQEDGNVSKALQKLKKHAAFVKILGSYPKAV